MLIIKRTTSLIKYLKFNHINLRPMYRMVFLKKLRPQGPVYVSQRGFTKKAIQVGKQKANDQTGKHTHIADHLCIIPACDGQRCLGLCATPKEYNILGHNTHKPPIGRLARFIDDHDANGDPKRQYFVPVNSPVTVKEQDKQQAGIKERPKDQAYIDKHFDKYE